MDRPRLFLSAVSEELRTARKHVAATLHTLGFDAISQDDFSTGYGELRQWLRNQVDSCDGLIQLVGDAYGAEPPEIDPEYGRVSYTQLEFLYAGRRSKKTWAIVIGKDFGRDKPSAQLDLPRNAGQADPTNYQAERSALQQGYIARLKRENHLRHTANNMTELELIIRKLPDWLAELHKQWEAWLKQDAEFKAKTSASLERLEEASRLTAEKIRAHLLQTAQETHRREMAEADREKDWRRRQVFRDAAESAQALRLSRIEELTAAFADIEGRGTATSVFQELTRILAEQGVDEAIAYIESQRTSIFQAVRNRAAAVRERNRAELQPLLRTAALYEAKGQATEARNLYSEILAVEPDWPEALHGAFWFHVEQGDLARVRTTLAEVREEYEGAHRIATRLTASDPSNTEWQRDLSVSYERLGNVAVAQGQLEAAAQAYREYSRIAKQLAASDPSNTEWQRDLYASYSRLAHLAEKRKATEEARANWKQAYDVLSGIDKRGLHLSPEDRKFLAILGEKVHLGAQ